MDDNVDILIKHREIGFCSFHKQEPDLASSAGEVLKELNGILEIEPLAPLLLNIRYDIRYITLEEIEYVLRELGFHLDGSLLTTLKRALYHYTEETLRANMGIEPGKENMQVYINRYQRLPHGCRDQRPEHWRSYL